MFAISSFNPLTYGVDGLRKTLANAANFGLGADISVLGMLSVALLVVGSYLFSKIQV